MESEVVESSSTETVAAPEATTSQNETSAALTTTPATAAEAYTPTYKFKVKDKEMDFDEYIKPVIKDKETESKIKDLYEKAYGLDEVKGSRDQYKTKSEEWEQKYSGVESSLKTLGTFVQKKDFRTFFDILNIPKQDIINYAIEELKYQELPADQKAAIEAQRQRDLDYESQMAQNQTLQQQMSNLVLQQATSELNMVLAQPEVVQAAQTFDANAGQQGALRAEVIRRGQYYEAVHKISPPASQLVQEILRFVGVNQPSQQNGFGASQGTLATQSQFAQQNQKPVIPSFSSGGASKSPIKKVPTSIDDLRKMRQQQNT